MLGDSGVGKSKFCEKCVIYGYNERSHIQSLCTRHSYKTESNKKEIQVELWDVNGKVVIDNSNMRMTYQEVYENAHMAIIIFDGNDKQSYENTGSWYLGLRKYLPNIPVFVVANKIDSDPGIRKR